LYILIILSNEIGYFLSIPSINTVYSPSEYSVSAIRLAIEYNELYILQKLVSKVQSPKHILSLSNELYEVLQDITKSPENEIDNLPAIRILLRAGVDPNQTIKSYKSSPMIYAQYSGLHHVVNLFNTIHTEQVHQILPFTGTMPETPSECFNPIEADMVNIGPDQIQFYIFTETNTIRSVACLSNQVQIGNVSMRTIDKLAQDASTLYFQCNDDVRPGAIMIRQTQVNPVPLRRLPFNTVVYVLDAKFQQLQNGHKYALVPTNQVVGRIASYQLIRGGTAVGGEHCQTYWPDFVYDIFEITEPITSPVYGGKKRTRKTNRNMRKT
jgi:hypothetical protein